jgi:hypothetical protein
MGPERPEALAEQVGLAAAGKKKNGPANAGPHKYSA